MKLLFEDRRIAWNDSFDVFDEIGRKMYRIEAREDGVRKKMKIYASYLHHKSVATLKESLDEAPAVEIKHGTRFVSVVRYLKVRRFFDLGFIGWYAAGNFEQGNFFLYDANDRAVASIGRTFTQEGVFRTIDTLPEYTLHSLTFTLAVDVQFTGEGIENTSPYSAALS